MNAGVESWKAAEVLRDTEVKGLTWGNLIELAPSVKDSIAKRMVLESDVTQRKVANPVSQGSNRTSVPPPGSTPENPIVSCMMDEADHMECLDIRGTAHAGAYQGDANVLQEPIGRITNFHTRGSINVIGSPVTYRINRLLVDGGSCLSMMPQTVADQMKLKLVPDNNLFFKTATGERRRIEFYVTIDLTVACVTSRTRAYILDIVPIYNMILRRRWLQQVKAMGNYATHTYIIHDAEGKSHQVPVCDEPPRVQGGGQSRSIFARSRLVRSTICPTKTTLN